MADRTVLVTGASRGIGRAIAERLAADRRSVLALSRSAPSDAFTSECIRHHAIDVADETEVQGLFDMLRQKRM
ncbi:MAG: SDR family NAD(P)-dependent oxidoreductase, partial [Geminicoccaceae bacterium]